MSCVFHLTQDIWKLFKLVKTVYCDGYLFELSSGVLFCLGIMRKNLSNKPDAFYFICSHVPRWQVIWVMLTART